eukprot:CAMPEP_0182499460 /NCGR_PEP_ID=MMETSP1321-20130603/7701_1 /TAXON_ID=91990 /ORGANISM="Bolidomonas sp., Strain RCC1657" /LENGTH=297 /DNA_ID=CAMNT_0024703663 /DNA_START=189 /DNA_END=1082 /DNA_ORIENTATION=-
MSRDGAAQKKNSTTESLEEPLLDLSTIRSRINEEKSRVPNALVARALPLTAAPLHQPSAPPVSTPGNDYGIGQVNDYDILTSKGAEVVTPMIATGVPLHTSTMSDFPDRPPQTQLLDFRGKQQPAKSQNYRPLEMSNSNDDQYGDSDSLLFPGVSNPHGRKTGKHQSRASSSNRADLMVADQIALQREHEEKYKHVQGQRQADAKNRQEKQAARIAGKLAEARDHDGDNVIDPDQEMVRRQIIINEQERRMEELGLSNNKAEEKEDEEVKFGGEGGYQCGEYETSSYETSEYKSIYD